MRSAETTSRRIRSQDSSALALIGREISLGHSICSAGSSVYSTVRRKPAHAGHYIGLTISLRITYRPSCHRSSFYSFSIATRCTACEWVQVRVPRSKSETKNRVGATNPTLVLGMRFQHSRNRCHGRRWAMLFHFAFQSKSDMDVFLP